NNSSDKKKLLELSAQTDINLILSTKNGGYSYGNNLGINKALSDGKKTFLILNPDIAIPFSTIRKMYNNLNTLPEVGILGCRICYRTSKDIIFSDGGLLFPEKGYLSDHTNYNEDKKFHKNLGLNYNIDYVDGSVLIF